MHKRTLTSFDFVPRTTNSRARPWSVSTFELPLWPRVALENQGRPGLVQQTEWPSLIPFVQVQANFLRQLFAPQLENHSMTRNQIPNSRIPFVHDTF